MPNKKWPQCVVAHPDEGQCKNQSDIKVHNTPDSPTYVCTKHYLQYQDKGLIFGIPTLIEFKPNNPK